VWGWAPRERCVGLITRVSALRRDPSQMCRSVTPVEQRRRCVEYLRLLRCEFNATLLDLRTNVLLRTVWRENDRSPTARGACLPARRCRRQWRLAAPARPGEGGGHSSL
jgi:hypothetical protein